ncbi:BTB/POZ domain-containing protein [Vitis vinifera]|uniref:BTB/POZ domain-containing protein n=1 Tax=Vitis vinifera TaxID=29760 RepID=A0A438E6H3_VITVI|nr:BTB/POZ domain-containing protein [Vitis vinifera]
MKFMKLGSRPDTFYTTEAVRSVSSEISSDLIVQFPLLSKCLRLQRLCSEFHESATTPNSPTARFPRWGRCIELCAKFCYGITITLSAFNIVSARCAARILQMTEDVEKGNLIYKLEVSSIPASFMVGRTQCDSAEHQILPFVVRRPWNHNRCIEAIASRVLSHPSKFLLKLLKAANILKASSSSKMELARKYSHDHTGAVHVAGAESPYYPTESQGEFEKRRSRSAENVILGFREQEAHPDLSKSERKRLCRILDCKKLSVEACMHAAQNELLPTEVVVQVPFFEQARAAMAGGQVTELPNNIKALLATHNVDPSSLQPH